MSSASFVTQVTIRRAKYLGRVTQLAEKFSVWRLERLPPPRVSQSQVRLHWSLFRTTLLLIASSIVSLTKSA